MPTPVTIDNFGREYLRLVLEIDKHIDGYIDAYYGPKEIKAEVESTDRQSPQNLLGQLQELQNAVPTEDSARRSFLMATLIAIECTVLMLSGETIDYPEEIARIYDIRPVLVDETIFTTAHNRLDTILPPDPAQSLTDRLAAWRQQLEIKGDGVLPLLELARKETRRRTAALLQLPTDENIEIKLTQNQPWGAYNWYKGDKQSLIEFNTDLPIQVPGLIGTFAHEGYPGHHTEHVLKETRLYREKGYAEQSAMLLHSPSAVIAEGIATKALEMIFPVDSQDDWNFEFMFPAAGIPQDETFLARLRAVNDATKPLRSVTANAALLYHTGQLTQNQAIDYIQTYGLVTSDRAKKSFSFISHPLFRSYIFTYTAGYDLISATHDPSATFLRLLTNQVLPSQLLNTD